MRHFVQKSAKKLNFVDFSQISKIWLDFTGQQAKMSHQKHLFDFKDKAEFRLSVFVDLAAVTQHLQQTSFSVDDTLGCRHVKMKQKNVFGLKITL